MNPRNELPATIKHSAKKGLLYGSLVGGGLGVGLGIFAYTAANIFNKAILPAVTTFYSRWGLTQPGVTGRTIGIMEPILACSALGVTGGAAAGAIICVAGSSAAFFAKKVLRKNDVPIKENSDASIKTDKNITYRRQ